MWAIPKISGQLAELQLMSNSVLRYSGSRFDDVEVLTIPRSGIREVCVQERLHGNTTQYPDLSQQMY